MAFKVEESLDTNIILRIALKDVSRQCEKIMDLFMRQNVVYHVADLAITEAVYVLQKNNSRQDVVDMLAQVLDLPNLKYNQALFDRVFLMYLQYPKLSFNDCCLAGYAALNESEPLWTFDQALAKESGTAKLLG